MLKISLLFLALVAFGFVVHVSVAAKDHGKGPGKRFDDKKIGIYELKKGNMSLKFTNWGATIISVFLPDKNGKIDDVVLGYDSVDDYKNDTVYFGAIVGRVANRIGGAQFKLNGTVYKLVANEGKNMLHGGKIGFSDVVWNVKKHKNEGFPGNLHVRVTYALSGDNQLTVKMKAKAENKATPVNLAQHTYWNLGGHTSGDILSEEIQIFASNYTPVDSDLIPTGQIVTVKGTPFDFLNSHAIGDYINKLPKGYDINYALDGGKGKNMKVVAIVIDKKSGRKMELTTNAPGVQFYTGFPGDLSVTTTYLLYGENQMSVTMRASSKSKATPVNLAQYIETPHDFLKPHTIVDNFNKLPKGYDINYVLDKSEGDFVKWAATVLDKKSERKMEPWTNAPGMQFYTGSYPKVVKGKGGFVYHTHAGLRLQTQNFPDSVNNPNFPATVIPPESDYRQTMEFNFSSIGYRDIFDSTKGVGLYEIKKGNLSVKLTNWGATIISVILPDKNGKLADVTLGYDSVKDYTNDTSYIGAIVGRFANRIGGAQFTLNGTHYKLVANEGKNMLHGGLRGFSDVVWKVKKYKNEGDAPTIVFAYHSFDGEEGFPGDLYVTVGYTLIGDKKLKVTMKAKALNKATPVNLAQHTYWNLGGHNSGNILSEEIQIFGSYFTPVDSKLIPTGKFAFVKGTPYDFLKPHKVGSRISKLPTGYDINYALDGGAGSKLR
ncbi:hypothetical protein Pint_19277 [Pistacia integerrima]|uniref:Uncharacterized protein n=1 Tax=Pistacia integerrima TaxID=434235 RepID=A0ACC0YVY6_9ROSI|nr:hypothetical protein Pint_19277 [Pistacia integerrima]